MYRRWYTLVSPAMEEEFGVDQPSIMNILLGEGGDLAFKKGIFWCHSGDVLHPNVEALQQRLGGNFKLCEIGGLMNYSMT